jgi:hypothetical protein
LKNFPGLIIAETQTKNLIHRVSYHAGTIYRHKQKEQNIQKHLTAIPQANNPHGQTPRKTPNKRI